MSKRWGGPKLGDVKGAELLRAFAERAKAGVTPAHPPTPTPTPPPTSDLSSEDRALLAAFETRVRATVPHKRSKRQKVKRNAQKASKMPGKFWREVVSMFEEQSGPSKSTPPSKSEPYDFGEAAFRRIAALRHSLGAFTAAHGAPSTIPEDTLRLVCSRVASGAARASGIVDVGDGYFIGYDFGTSATKTVLRHPYNPALSAFALPVPREFASNGQPNLWPTAVWFDMDDQRFSPVPQEGYVCLHGFKSAIIEDQGHRMCCGAPVTMLSAATAFLAMHIAYAIGTALERAPSLLISGVNFAAPVAALKNAKAAGEFERLVTAALSLVPCASELTLAQVANALQSGKVPAMPHYMCTELSAAIAGYCSAPRHFQGPHVILDCGSATLDIASFTIGDAHWPIDICGASVERLGADSCATYRASGVSLQECAKAVQFQQHSVRAGGAVGHDGKLTYQLVLVGGGIEGEVCRMVVTAMEPRLRHRPHRPELSQDLEFDREVEPGRLILADGLARDPIEFRKVLMPLDRDHGSISSGSGLPYGPGFVSKDDV